MPVWPSISRRTFVHGAAGLAGVAAVGSLAACTGGPGSIALVDPGSPAVAAAERARRVAGRRVVSARLTPRPVTVDSGVLLSIPGPTASRCPDRFFEQARATCCGSRWTTKLPVETRVHWHGLALRDGMDGVPHLTQDPIPAGGSFDYEFTAPDPGIYFYHPHSGVQLDRGLYGVLIIDDPAEPGSYDDEWIVVLDDWVDGTGRTPDQVLATIQEAFTEGPGGSMDGMDHGSMMGGMGEGMQSPMFGGAGDIEYPHYLTTGRTPSTPRTFTGRPGQRIRIRFINAGSDTAFRVDVGSGDTA